jgi:hypothetical protein
MSPAKPKPQQRQGDPWRANEEAQRRQVREDARRPLAVNLAEGLVLSEFISTLPGAEYLSDQEALEAFRAAQEGDTSET